MFERFSDSARRVVVEAQEEARDLSHNYIGTEHLLLGLLHDEHSRAGVAPGSCAVTLESGRRAVEELVGAGPSTPDDHIPFTPAAKKALDMALREAIGLHDQSVSSEHLVLGLLRADSVVSDLMGRLGVEPAELRTAVTVVRASQPPEDGPPLPPPRPPPPG